MSDEIKYTIQKLTGRSAYQEQIDTNQFDPYSDDVALFVYEKEKANAKTGKPVYYLTDDSYTSVTIDEMVHNNKQADYFKKAAAKFNFPEIKMNPETDEIYCDVTNADLDQEIKHMTKIINEIYEQLKIELKKIQRKLAHE